MQSRVLLLRNGRIANLCFNHWQAVVAAFVLGILAVAPQLLFMRDPAYRGIEMIGSDAEEYYVARMQEVYDGYPGMGGVFIPQKDHPYLVPGLGENIVARPGRFLNLTAPIANVGAKFIFPFITVLLVYALVYTLSASIPGALLASVLVVAGDAVFGGPGTLLNVFSGRDPITSFLSFSRPVNPEVSAVFLFTSLLIIGRNVYMRQMFTWRSVTALGLLAGGALYISPFISTFLFAFMGFFFLWSVYNKDYDHAKALAAGVGVGIATVVPFLINLLKLRHGPFYAETSIRQGLTFTHAPVLGFWLGALVLVQFVWPHRFRAIRPFFAIATVALIVLLNQQIVTGIVVQPAHYHWYLTKPLAGLVIALFSVAVIDRLLKTVTYRIAGYGLCCVVVLLSAGLVQRASYRAHYAQAVETQAYAPVFAFLKTLSPKQTVWANQKLSLYIPMYTQHDVPNNQYAEYDSVLQTYLERRLYLEYSLRKIPVADALTTMQIEREDIAFRLFGVHWRDQYGSYSALPDHFLERYARDYKEIARRTMYDQLREFGISVVVWDEETDPEWKADTIRGLTSAFSNERFHVYLVSTSTPFVQPME